MWQIIALKHFKIYYWINIYIQLKLNRKSSQSSHYFFLTLKKRIQTTKVVALLIYSKVIVGCNFWGMNSAFNERQWSKGQILSLSPTHLYKPASYIGCILQTVESIYWNWEMWLEFKWRNSSSRLIKTIIIHQTLQLKLLNII